MPGNIRWLELEARLCTNACVFIFEVMVFFLSGSEEHIEGDCSGVAGRQLAEGPGQV